MIVLVSGPPASGKSTLAPSLARELGLPLLQKDVVKDVLLAELGADDVEESRRLGHTAVKVLLAVAAVNDGLVLESVWHRPQAVTDLAPLADRLVEVFCRCDRDTLARRYADRASTRGAGHFDLARTADELWGPATSEPVAGGWPVIEVVTTVEVDVVQVASAVLGAGVL